MPKRVIAAVIGLVLVSFVSPFSYLPNPLGLVYLFTGGYSYDARQPLLVNGFAVLARGDVEAALRARLDGLIGATGLDPLDPNQPLQGYAIETVTYGDGDWAEATVQMRYADGSSRRYRIPVVESRPTGRGFPGWTYTGLDRLAVPHEELPHLPLATPDAPVRLGAPLRLPVTDETHQLGTGTLVGWYTSGPRSDETPIWSPTGDAFLLATSADRRSSQNDAHLWLVPVVGPMAKHIAVNAEQYTWSPDGKWIVFLRSRRVADAAKGLTWEVLAVDREGKQEHALGQTDLAARPTVVGDAVWYLTGSGLWRVNLVGGADASRVGELPELRANARGDAAYALTPDADRIAYRCENALCLADADGQNRIQVELESDRAEGRDFALAWNQGGDRLAVVTRSDVNANVTPVLWVVDRTGQVLQRVAVGPNGSTGDPQWTPDGSWIFLNTFPEAGRRIVAVEAESGRVLDLTQSRWDALFSLGPDGRRLLLWNGRGGFWLADVVFDVSRLASPTPSSTPTPRPTPTPQPATPTATPSPLPSPTPTPTRAARTPTPRATREPTVTGTIGTPTPVATRFTGPGSVPPSPRYEPLPLRADGELEAKIRDYLGDDVGRYGIVVKRLSDGRGVAINADRRFYAASLFKILVMYEVYKQRELGLLSFDEELPVTPPYLEYMLGELPWPLWSRVSIGELVEAMITVSDNVAAMMLHDKTGGWNIIRDYQSIGLVHTDLARTDLPTSARDMALWVEMIARGQAIDEATSREMIDLMSRQKVNDRLPALLPDGVVVAHKTGNWDSATHDVGVVYAPGGAYVIAVLSDLAWDGKPIAELSRLVYDYFVAENGNQ